MIQLPLLSVQHLTGKMGDNNAVNNISFYLNEGEKLAITGETGSGKTTLLKMLAGFLQPLQGKILFRGEKVKGPDEQLIAGHPRIAYLSQYFELRNNYYVRDYLEMAVTVSKEKADLIYQVCRITHLLDRRTNALSGGERQRTALARLLTTAPSILLLDEPFSHLDFSHKEVIRQVLTDVKKEFETSFIMISHDATDLLSWADRILIMKDGMLKTEGAPKVLFYQPPDSYSAGLMGPYSIVSDKLAKRIHLFLPDSGNLFYCVRPGQIKITENASFPEALIDKIVFFGNYHLISLTCEDESLQMTTLSTEYKVGQRVRICMREGMSLQPVGNHFYH